MDSYIIAIKGVSGSGKSSRVFQLIKFFEKINLTISNFYYKDDEGKLKNIGIFIEEMGLVILGKYYKSGTVERFQGYDSVTGCFKRSSNLSEFLKNNNKYSFIVEGAGITSTNRLRPKFLHEYCGFNNILIQYYNYDENGKEDYLKRIIFRSGKVPTRCSMWNKNRGFSLEYEKSINEKEIIDSNKNTNVLIYKNTFDTPINDFGEKFLKFIGCEGAVQEFNEFVRNFDYISLNNFENFKKTQGDIKEPITEEKQIHKIEDSIKLEEVEKVKNDSIFPVFSLDRSIIHWEDYLLKLTPVERIGDLYIKRDDKFAPLGYGGINGSKLRQAIFLISNYIKNGGKGNLISGASVKSPQLPMGSAVAMHFGIKSSHVIGATKPKYSIKRDMVKLATWFGASFNYIKIGYNPVLQSTVQKMLKTDEHKDDFYLNYGITPDVNSSDKNIEMFYRIGGNQASNIPDDVEDIILPAGNCNSCLSVLFGLAMKRPKNLKTVHLLGIGPNKMKFIQERLNSLRKSSGLNCLNFVTLFKDDRLVGDPDENSFNLTYCNLHEEKYTDYQSEIKFTYDGLVLHPTYEGKMMSYVHDKLPELIKPTTLFWVVGSKPSIKNMSYLKDVLGEIPTETKVESNAWEYSLKKNEPLIEHEETCDGENCSVTKQIINNKITQPIILDRYCNIHGINEENNLVQGLDFRKPEYRREVFLRFYEFHLKYRSHPGGVYFLLPYLAEVNNWTKEQKYWYAFINGCTQNPCTSWVIFNKFPIFDKITFEDFETWHRANWKKLQYDIDRRYQKGHLVEMWESYVNVLNGRTQEEFFERDICNTNDPNENFNRLWKVVFNDFYMYGRLSSFSYLEYLKIIGLNINCWHLFMDDLSGSKSHRNGICKVLGRDDLDCHKGNEKFKVHPPEVIEWLKIEGAKLLEEAKERFKDKDFIKDVNYFTLESTLCCYKSWHRVNRRYPNVYMDMMVDRIKFAEKQGWESDGIDFDIFWKARKNYLPKELRLEDNPKDPGLKPIKMNHYRLTGEVIMMDTEWECFNNNFNK